LYAIRAEAGAVRACSGREGRAGLSQVLIAEQPLVELPVSSGEASRRNQRSGALVVRKVDPTVRGELVLESTVDQRLIHRNDDCLDLFAQICFRDPEDSASSTLGG